MHVIQEDRPHCKFTWTNCIQLLTVRQAVVFPRRQSGGVGFTEFVAGEMSHNDIGICTDPSRYHSDYIVKGPLDLDLMKL